MDAAPRTSSELTRLILAVAEEFGFEVVGMAPAEEVLRGDAFRGWLASGEHAGMDYLGRHPDRRLDPRRLDPRFRSVVSMGMSYWNPPGGVSAPEGPASGGDPPASRDPVTGPPRGRIARYAWGADYHNVMVKKLRRLLGRLRIVIPGVVGRAYVDTGPVMDRAWAARSGVGWWGKHTNIVSREHGSWLLLGTLLLNLELDYDQPHGDYCGTCRRCIDACPTRAIVAERRLDARRCISYWTIEHRGPIPLEMRPLIGGWIFGCDLCLDVCPWNRFARAARESRFAAREDRAAPELIPLLFLTSEEFRRKFNGSPIQRPGRNGFVRNVCVALGNVGGPGALEALERVAATDPSGMVREHAAWAVDRLRRPE